MSVRLRTQVAQLSMVAGVQRDKASNIGLLERSSIVPVGTGKGSLYLLVEVTGNLIGWDDICRELIEILSKEYLRVPGGITNGLRQAIRAANRFLYGYNLHSLPEDRRIGETSCAVFRGNDLYIGLAGGSRIYVIRGEELRLFPPPPRHPAPFPPVEQPSRVPLGVQEYLQDVGLFHCLIRANDAILLASSTLSELASQQQVIQAFDGGLGETTHSLSSLASQTDFSALIIRTEAEEREEVLRRESLATTGRSIAAGMKKVPVGEVVAGVKKIPARKMASGLGRMVDALLNLALAAFVGLANGARALISWLLSSGIFETLGRWVRAFLASILRGSRTMATRMLPEPTVTPQPMETVHARPAKRVVTPERNRLLPVMGLLTTICAIVLVAAGVIVFNRSRGIRFSQLLEEAMVERDLAQSGSTGAAVREHLGNAQALVEQALQVRPTDPEAVALQEEVFLLLDEIDQVARLDFSASMPLAESENQPRRVLLHGNDAYVLDNGTQTLYGYLLDGQNGFQEPEGGFVLLSREDQSGDTTILELNDFIWMEAGNGRENSSLLVLVNGRSLLQLDSLRGFTSVSVADSQRWGEPHRIAAYFGYLYVLDVAEDRIWKYAPTGDTYDLAPTAYFQAETGVELDNAVDMAIDGFIYVLLDDGSILKFSGGEQEAFSVTGLDDHAFQNPTAIFTSPETDHIYVADAGNERVVQLDKEGTFVRQFRPHREASDAFQNLQDIFVNEAEGEFLVLGSDGLYLALIPELLQADE